MTLGSGLVGYSLLLYPIIGALFGHRYPATPTFGAPCPVTIFTFGIFCLIPDRIPRAALAIPLIWTAISSYAAIGLGVFQDLGLLAGAIAVLMVHQHEKQRHPLHQFV